MGKKKQKLKALGTPQCLLVFFNETPEPKIRITFIKQNQGPAFFQGRQKISNMYGYAGETICHLLLRVSSNRIHHFNVIVFIRAIDHVITMLCHVNINYGWHNHFRLPVDSLTLIPVDSSQILLGQINPFGN